MHKKGQKSSIKRRKSFRKNEIICQFCKHYDLLVMNGTPKDHCTRKSKGKYKGKNCIWLAKMAYLSLFSQLGNLSFVMPQMVVNSALLSFQPLIITYSMRPFFVRLRVLRGRSHRFGVKRGWRGRRRILPHQCRMLLIQRHSLGVGPAHAHDLMGRLDPHGTTLL